MTKQSKETTIKEILINAAIDAAAKIAKTMLK